MEDNHDGFWDITELIDSLKKSKAIKTTKVLGYVVTAVGACQLSITLNADKKNWLED